MSANVLQVRASLVSLVAIAVCLLALGSASRSSFAAVGPRGDVDCSGTTDAVDPLKLLGFLSGLDVSQAEPCVDIGLAGVSGLVGDIECDHDVDVQDVIVDLEIVAMLPVDLCPDPISVNVTLDAVRSASTTIPESGGTLSATAEDGTVFTLTFPPYAVAGAQEVTMTPLASVAGVDFSGGYVGGVQLEPSGLELWQPATLKIEPPAPIPDGNLITFGYAGEGEDFHLEPVKPGVSGIEIAIIHFSGAGAGSGSADDRSAIQQHTPGDGSSQLAQQIAGLDPNDPGFDAAATEIMSAYYNDHVGPMLQQATTDAGLFDAALNEFLHWLYLTEVGVGDVDAQVAAGWQLVEAAALNAVNDAHDKCVANHDLTKAARIAHIAYLGEVGLVPNFDLQAAFPILQSCLRFELEIDSRIVGADMTTQVHGTADLVLQQDFTIAGSGAIDYFVFIPPPSDVPDCTFSWTTHGSTMSGRGLNLGGVFSETGRDLTLIFNPGTPVEHLSRICSGPPYSSEDNFAFWEGTYFVFHAAEVKPAIGTPLVMEHWTAGQGGIFATKFYGNTGQDV